MTRKEARAELTGILKHEGEYMDYLTESEVEAIKTLAEEPKQGEWIEILRHYTGLCSICGKVAEITNYCPNCGAKMKEGDEK